MPARDAATNNHRSNDEISGVIYRVPLTGTDSTRGLRLCCVALYPRMGKVGGVGQIDVVNLSQAVAVAVGCDPCLSAWTPRTPAALPKNHEIVDSNSRSLILTRSRSCWTNYRFEHAIRWVQIIRHLFVCFGVRKQNKQYMGNPADGFYAPVYKVRLVR